ncbi:hypothetical protein BKA83DRAFT_12141 [Pisolithus microcarpus]|nr:hypothetical protein BKA83DRAFT_12141 [Pisolithus microcarpus]
MSARQLAVCDRMRERRYALFIPEEDRESAYPDKMWEKIQLLENYSILGDEEEVEDEADEAGQVFSAPEKSKEDPIKKAISIKLDDLSGNSFVEFLGSVSHSRAFKAYASKISTSEEMTEEDGEGAGDTNEEIYEFMGLFAVRTSTGYSHEITIDSVLQVPDVLKRLEEITNAEKPFTLLLDDPFAHSYLQNLYVPDPDPNMEMSQGENHIAEDHIVMKRFEGVTSNHTNDFNQHSNREEYCASDFNTRTSRCMAAGHGTGTIILCTLKLALV